MEEKYKALAVLYLLIDQSKQTLVHSDDVKEQIIKVNSLSRPESLLDKKEQLKLGHLVRLNKNGGSVRKSD